MPKPSGSPQKPLSGNSRKTLTRSAPDTLRNLAFDHSAQASLISSVSNAKIILANRAACQLLGYSKNELLTKTETALFDPYETGFRKMRQQRRTEGHCIGLVCVVKKNGRSITCEINSAIFTDADGVKHAITTIADRSESILKQKGIDIEKKKRVDSNILLVESNQKKIDAKKDRIVAHNIDLARSKQNTIDIRKDKKVADDIILAQSKQHTIDIRKDKKVADNIILAQTKQLTIDIKKDKKVADNIILAQTKSDTREAANNVLHKERFKLLFNSSSDVLYEFDLITHEIMISDAYEREFGYKTTGSKMPIEDWVQHIYPEDKIAIRMDYLRMLGSKDTKWNCQYRFVKADGSISNVSGSGIVLRNVEGKVYRMIGSMQDISKQKVLEARLEEEIALKEMQISEAMKDAKETERSDIGRELHDNVNQLLGASRLYLDMAKQGGPESEMYLSRSSEYTLTAIEEIRKLTKSLTTASIEGLELQEAIDQIVHDLMEVSNAKISCVLQTFMKIVSAINSG